MKLQRLLITLTAIHLALLVFLLLSNARLAAADNLRLRNEDGGETVLNRP